MIRAAYEQLCTPLSLCACLLGTVILAACTDDVQPIDSDTQVDEDLIEEQNYLELGWIGNWNKEFSGTHLFYSRDVLSDEYICLFRWQTNPILDSEGVVALNNSCGDDGVSPCEFEFVQEIEYTNGSLLSDPLTQELTDCKTFSLADGSALGETRKYAYEATPVSDPTKPVLMQYYEATDSQAAGWYELAYATYDEGLDTLDYSRAYAYYELKE
ncbi:MAG: hypothetical protein ACI9VR_004542 [Cognaticolwellia sp.]|jgi:hypothetical protein